MNRISQWILRAFLWPFLASLGVILFILTLQLLLSVLDKLAGKGLDTLLWIEIFVRVAEVSVVLAMPIAILAAALVTFGNLSERKEMLALKASGTNPVRLYLPMIGLSILLALFSLHLSFQTIPHSQKRLWTLIYHISKTKPTLQLVPGTVLSGHRWIHHPRISKRYRKRHDLRRLDLSSIRPQNPQRSHSCRLRKAYFQ